MDKEAAAALGGYDHWFRHWMPWKLVQLGAGDEHVYLPVNRGLKPLGFTGTGWVRWREHAAQAVVVRSGPHEFEGVWYHPPGAVPGLRRPGLVLYDDTPESRMDYFTRFERLMTRASWLNGASSA